MRRMSSSAICAFFAVLFAVSPAGATIEKIMNQCDGKLCPFFRASTAIPDGWVEDRDSTRYFNSQFLLPKGIDFEKAGAKIYVAVKYNRKKLPISDFMPENMKDWRNRAKDYIQNKLAAYLDPKTATAALPTS